MTYSFEYLMQIVSCTAVGNEFPEPLEEIDWEQMLKLAISQSVLPLFAYAVCTSKNSFIPEQIIAQMKQKTLHYAGCEIRRRNNMYSLLDDMKEKGFSIILLKGTTLQQYYYVPDMRISSDIDIYVSKDQEKDILQYFEDHNFIVDRRNSVDLHSECVRDDIGLVEVHGLLYDEFIEDIWFNRIKSKGYVEEPYIEVKTSEGCFNTLGLTDNMIFLSLHLIKHFIISGMSLQQMLDVTLFYVNNYNQIDLKRYWRVMEELDFKTLINTIIGATIKYCGLSNEWNSHLNEIPTDDAMTIILDDLENGGHLGYNEKKARNEGWHAFNIMRGIKNKGKLRYNLYMVFWTIRANMHVLFPNKEYIADRYPYTSGKAFLVPFVWFKRLIFTSFKYIFKSSNTSEIISEEAKISKEGKLRIDMFKRLKMI